MKDKKYIKYGLFTSILIALGPILWLFINIYHKNYEPLVLNIASVIVTITLVFYNLRNYLKVYNKKCNIALDLLSYIVSFIFYILLIPVFVIASIGFSMLISLIQQKLFIRGEYLTYLIKSPYSYLFFVILIIVVSRIKLLISREGKFHCAKKTYLCA